MFQVLKENKDFRRLFLGQVFSLAGDWFNFVAVVTLIGDVRGGGIMALAWLTVIKQLPVILFSAVGGVFADRFSRRKIMLYSDLIRAVLAVLIIPATNYGPSAVLAVIGLSAIISAFFDPARTACLPQLVEPSQLRSANALGSMAWSTCMILGAALGGVVTEYFGVNFALIIDGVTFLVSAWLIYKLPPLYPTQHHVHTEVTFRDFIKYRLFSVERKIAVLVKGLFGIGAAVNFIQSVIGLSLGIGASGAGGLSATLCARAFGALSGMIVAKKFFDSKSEIDLITVGMFFCGLSYFAVGISESIPLFLFSMFTAHFGSSLVWVYSTIWIQRIFPNEERGRAAGLDIGLFMLTSCVVTVLSGELITRGLLTPRGVAEMCGVFWILVAVTFIPIKRIMHRYA